MRNVLFAVVILLMAFLIYVYPLNILGHLLFGTKVVEPAALFPTIGTALVVFGYFRTHGTSPLLSGFAHYGMGLGFIGFCVFNVGLLVSLALPQMTVEIGTICLAVFLITCIKSLHNGQKLTVKTLDISSKNIKKPVKMVFISDVHLGSNKRQHLENICERMSDLAFDHLLIGGDLFDSSAFAAEDLTPLKAIQQPIHFVTGNHEYYVRNHERKVADLQHYNITTLDNEAVQIDELNIIGVSDNQAPKKQAEIAKGLIDQDKFNLLLVHQPGMWDHAPERTDLMLSGHTHNGQIFPFNFLVRLQFKTVYGLYERLHSVLYVSSGSGTWGPRMRLGTQNEIIHIILTPQQDVP